MISEVMYHPPDFGLIDNTRDEYIELVNPTAASMTLQDANGSVSLRFEDFDENSSAEGIHILECIPDHGAESPLALLEKEDRKRELAAHISELPEKEKFLLSLYFCDELTMKEIGMIMKLTEGRVCQLPTQALIRLKARISQEFCAEEI